MPSEVISIPGAKTSGFIWSSPFSPLALQYTIDIGWSVLSTTPTVIISSLPGEPTESEYYGILEWKHKEGHYKRPEVEAQIKKEIEFGSKKYGITAPAWAGGYLKQYETAAKTIKSAYLKAAEAAEKPTEIEMKKEKPPPTKKITIEDVLKYQKVSESEQRPEVRQYIETTVGTGETARSSEEALFLSS